MGTISAEKFNKDYETGEDLLFNDQASIRSFNSLSLRKFVAHTDASVFFSSTNDVLCLQEVQSEFGNLQKCQDLWPKLANYKYGFWAQCTNPVKRGQAGTAIFTVSRPVYVSFGMANYDDRDGRVITLRFKDITIINIYHQCLGPGEDTARREKRLRLDQLFLQHVKDEQQIQTVVICGDFNVPISPRDISVVQPWGKIDFAIPRAGILRLLDECKLRDTGNEQPVFTWYSYPLRKNQMLRQGMRIDYIFVPEGMHTSALRTLSQIYGSDHKAVELVIYGKKTPSQAPSSRGPHSLVTNMQAAESTDIYPSSEGSADHDLQTRCGARA